MGMVVAVSVKMMNRVLDMLKLRCSIQHSCDVRQADGYANTGRFGERGQATATDGTNK